MQLIAQLMRPFSIRAVTTGSVWRPKRSVVIVFYAAVFAFGFLLAGPIARLGVSLGLDAIALSVTTIAAIIASMLLAMALFDRCLAGRIAISARLVRALFFETAPKRRPGDRSAIRLVSADLKAATPVAEPPRFRSAEATPSNRC